MKIRQLPTALALSWEIQHPKRRNAWSFTASSIALSWALAYFLSSFH